MTSESGAILFIVVICLIIGSVVGWKIRNTKVKELIASAASNEAHIIRQAKAAIAKLEKEMHLDYERVTTQLKTANKNLHELYSDQIVKIKEDCVLLPSAVEWASRIQDALDAEIVEALVKKDRPAPRAAEEVKKAQAEIRSCKRAAEILKNRVALYEAEAPWLVEFAEYSVAEIVEGLRQEAELKAAFIRSSDPSRLFLSASEWSKLSESDRNQLALDRYWEYRQRNAWAAGVQYERFIGYTYEIEGYHVIYHGATQGVRDLGIDLVCTKGSKTLLVQCKRLSVEKCLPVRENTVAQIYGASLYYTLTKKLKKENVTPIIVTTYDLSPEARDFAAALGVTYRERVCLELYPCIKCNISNESGEKIYHLPFDQQYDVTLVEIAKGDRYAKTISEAVNYGFRRAMKWYG